MSHFHSNTPLKYAEKKSLKNCFQVFSLQVKRSLAPAHLKFRFMVSTEELFTLGRWMRSFLLSTKRSWNIQVKWKLAKELYPDYYVCCVLWFLTGKPVQAAHRCYIKARLKFIWGHSNTNLFMNVHHVSIMWGKKSIKRDFRADLWGSNSLMTLKWIKNNKSSCHAVTLVLAGSEVLRLLHICLSQSCRQ